MKPKSIEEITVVCGKTTTMQKVTGHLQNLAALGLGTDKVRHFKLS